MRPASLWSLDGDLATDTATVPVDLPRPAHDHDRDAKCSLPYVEVLGHDLTVLFHQGACASDLPVP